MLEIKNVTKKYQTGDLVQVALNGVSINLRDNEFVAILGPSGSGKTTLLNIIGGLDRYDSGDLIINHVSTKKYKDKDWDSYRNHTIGFVFQSYNLIPHQSVLKNVELALTISGISKKERTRRALEALDKVGLKDQSHKKPNQMSGGQMQRVAIARALVNNPDILLADEPTGALDSKTSYQVMDLLKEVAKDRLVVMVSHNPELAKEYATRIVRIKDGEIIDDSDPFDVESEQVAIHKNLGRAKMSFGTALALSFNNLLSKKGRTILTAFAGSIGIIGIALILALSQGFQNYIDMIQEDTMTSYPLTIQSETTDIFSAMLTSELHGGEETKEGYVKEIPIVTTMTDTIGSNDIKSFKKWLEDNEDLYHDDVKRIDYAYSVSPLIYTKDVNDKIVQLNPSTIMSSIYSEGAMAMLSSISASTSMGSFSATDFSLLDENYELLKGRYPKNYDEVIIVLNSKNMIPDLFVYSLGLRDISELQKIMQSIMNGEQVSVDHDMMTLSYDDLMNVELKLVDANRLYKYNDNYGTYENMSDDEAYIEQIYDSSISLKITGIAYSENGSGVLYSKKLTDKVIENAYSSEIVQKQLSDKNTDVFSNTPFDEDKNSSGLDFNDMVTIDENLLKEAFVVNISEDDFKFDMMDESQMQSIILNNAKNSAQMITSGPNVTQLVNVFTTINMGMLNNYISAYESANKIVNEIKDEDDNIIQSITMLDLSKVDEYALNINGNNYKNALSLMIDTMGVSSEYSSMLQILQDSDYDSFANSVKLMFIGYYDDIKTIAKDDKVVMSSYSKDSLPEQLKELLGDYFEQLSDGDILTIYSEPDDNTNSLISTSLLVKQMGNEEALAYVNNSINNIVNNFTTYVIAASIGQSVGEVMTPMVDALSGLGDKFSEDVISIDTDKFQEAFKFNMNEDELSRLMESMMKKASSSYNNNLTALGYQDIEEPTAMSIYFTDFDAKDHFLDLISTYNDNVNEEKKISYTDMTGLLMSSVQTIISSVTYVLIAFVSISLIVSSIMIAVITLISVMERTKEIGILRAMGASKANVSSIFNAETFIIGLLSGSLGILVSYLSLIPINMFIHSINTDITAVLYPSYALILIGISVVLTIISGLIPSRKAAKQDPVIALRTE